jgi:hypothetical protein
MRISESRFRVTEEVKYAAKLRAEAEARRVLQEAELVLQERAAAKAKARAEIECLAAAARASSKAKAEAAALEEARIEASGKDEWFYLQDDVQYGPVTLVELREKISDPGLSTPIKLVWAEGMEIWRPAYEVRRVCDPEGSYDIRALTGAVAALVKQEADGVADDVRTRNAGDPHPPENDPAWVQPQPAATYTDRERALEEARLREAAEADAREQSRLRANAEATIVENEKLRVIAEAKAAEESRVLTEALAKAREQANLLQAAEARAREELRLREIAEAKVRAEALRRAAAEAKAAEEERIALAAKARAEEEAQAKARIEAEAAEQARAAAIANARAEEELKLRKEAEAKAAEEARRAAAANERAEQEARAKALSEARAAEESRIAACEKARAEEEARMRREAEARAAEQARQAAIAKARAESDAKARAELEARALIEARARAEAQAKAEAQAQEDARQAEAAKAKANAEILLKQLEPLPVPDSGISNTNSRVVSTSQNSPSSEKPDEEAMLAAEINALAEQEAKFEAMAKDRAEKEAKAKAEFKSRASQSTRAAIAAKRKVRRQVLARAMESARMQALEQAATALMEEPKPAEEPAVAIVAEVSDPEPQAVVNEATVLPEITPAAVPEVVVATPPSKRRHSILTGRRVWYYTSEGERVGPITFEELKEMAENSTLNPRLDLVWKKGAVEWLPAGKIDGLFHRAESQEPTRPSTFRKAGAVRSAPRAKVSVNDQFWPGARRRSLLVVALVLPFVWNFAWHFMKPALSGKVGAHLMDRIAPLAAWVPLVLVLHFAWKRLVNLGMSRWWSLAVLAPVLNLWVGYRCFACPQGYAFHRRMDAAGFLLGLAYWGLVLAVLSSVFGLSGPWSAWVEPSGLKTQIARAIQSVHSLAFR